ncbi:hypothetical protein DMN91_011018 [Ooceraea biroi]|uniref:DDE Tnp4 domain-containing protein n=1 Tax=Ooceraea biroi TaxID=2015173 RepID=A0A3L8DAQ5_OOCBI|nr:hypothetical protein DMN91_011018 [Ooceraea biroi]
MGDPAYPLLDWLIKGYTKSTQLTSQEESFNVYLNAGRVCVEIAFGRLKARWRRLLKRSDLHYTYMPNVISACCVLHNILEAHKERYINAWDNIVQEAQSQLQQPQRTTARDLNNLNGSLMRDTLKDYLGANFQLRRTFLH